MQPVIAYPFLDKLYLNVTNRCTLRCSFCPKAHHTWTAHDHNLRLRKEPTVSDILAAVGDPGSHEEIVFSGLGEPTMRLYIVLEAANELRRQGGRIRLVTDGLANLIYDRDVTADLESNVDVLSVSLNAQDEATYNRVCCPRLPNSYQAMLEFTERAYDFVPEVVLTAIDGVPGVDVAACAGIAEQRMVGFQPRVLNGIE